MGTTRGQSPLPLAHRHICAGEASALPTFHGVDTKTDPFSSAPESSLRIEGRHSYRPAESCPAAPAWDGPFAQGPIGLKRFPPLPAACANSCPVMIGICPDTSRPAAQIPGDTCPQRAWLVPLHFSRSAGLEGCLSSLHF